MIATFRWTVLALCRMLGEEAAIRPEFVPLEKFFEEAGA